MSPMMHGRRIVSVLVLAGLLRVGLFATAWNRPDGLFKPDSNDYIELSDSLAETGNFQRDSRPEVFRTPGYPAFLLLGVPFGTHWWRVTVLVQIALDVLVVYLTYLLGWMLLGRAGGLWAALLQAICVVAIVSAVRLLSDGLFAVLLTLAVLLFVHHLRTSAWWSLTAAAAVLGAGCYVRPVGLAFAAVLLAVLIVRARRLRQAGAFAALVAACVCPWVVRNGLRTGYWGFSSFATDTLYAYAAPQVLARVEGISAAQARRRIELFHPPRPGETIGQAVARRRRAALEVIMQHPVAYATTHLNGVVGFFLPAATDVLEVAGLTSGGKGTLAVLRAEGLVAAVRHYFDGNRLAMLLAAPMVLVPAAVYLGAAACFVVRFGRRSSAVAWTLLLMVAVAAVLAGPANVPRFRVPVAPLLNVCAVAGWTALGALRKRRRA